MTQHIDIAPSGFPKRKLVGMAFAGALVCGAAAIAFVGMRGQAETTTLPTSDVPRRVGDGIEVSDSFRNEAGIATAPVTRSALMPAVKVVGEAAFDPRHVAAVGARASGIVREVFYVEGDKVERGAVLAEIESPNLAEIQAEKRIAAARKNAASVNAARERSLLDRRLTTAREHEQAVVALEEQKARAAAAEERVEALGGSAKMGVSELRAPTSGIVAERTVAPGQSVGPGDVAFRVGDVDELWVLLRVFERHVGMIRSGDDVEIRPMADPASVIHGKVAHVGAVIDDLTRTTDVRVEVNNEARHLRPGQAVGATIRASGPARIALSVPSTALTMLDGVPTVFVAESPTRFVARRVELGIDGGDRVEIVSGVNEGDLVVSKQVLALKSELYR